MGRIHQVIRYLLDTQIVLWAVEDSPRLPRRSRRILADGPRCYVSIASIWEMSINEGIGKLNVPADLLDRIASVGATILPITVGHARAVRDLPRHHNDPFDRMIVAQARMEGLALISVDREIARYDVDLIR